MKYSVNEYFHSLQGEGFYTGTPSFFLRLQGCDVGCTFCDTKYTWSFKSKEVSHEELKERTPTHAKLTAKEILKISAHEKHLVITGGEPTLHDLYPLTHLFHENGVQCQIETSGTEFINADPRTWVTLSPKFGNPGNKPLLESCVNRANEFKFPVDENSDFHALDMFFSNFEIGNRIIWLQPISQGKKATEACIVEASKRGWRVSIQTHKFLGLR